MFVCLGTVCLAYFWTRKRQYQNCMLMGHFKYHKHLLEITCAHLLDVNVFLSKPQNQRTFPRYGFSIHKFFPLQYLIFNQLHTFSFFKLFLFNTCLLVKLKLNASVDKH